MNTKTVTEKKVLNLEWQKLESNLSRQLINYEKCLDTGLKQRIALVNNNLEQNQAINKAQDRLIARSQTLEQERVGIVKEFCMSLLKNGYGSFLNDEAIKCEELYPYMPEEIAETIKNQVALLKTKVAQIKELHTINVALIQSARTINHATIQIITGLSDKKPAQQSKTYGTNGQMVQNKKQKISLYSRKV
ncbi:MAG: flagellar export chaperone FlgN [Fibrobacteria bacterium]|nr:flagellar export chaperone FlgN [Fibrobacteria bacterium]